MRDVANIYLCESLETVVNPQELCAMISIGLERNVILNYVFGSFYYI